MHRTAYRSFLLMLMITFFLPITSFAWNAQGHMVVTQIAYEQLNATAKQKVDDLVYYFAKEYPSTPTLLHMSVWPDAIRSQKIDIFARWHYIDVPFSDDRTALGHTISTDNASWALNNVKNVVKNERANAYERARFLAFTIHIVGDLHQPLHTVTRVTAARPEGDRGGNSFTLEINRYRTNLHRVWDGGVGALAKGTDMSEVRETATDIMARYPQSQFGDKTSDLTTKTWEKEGMKNATTYVYNTKEGEPASNSYITNGKRIAEAELALAGYRLGNLLNSLLS